MLKQEYKDTPTLKEALQLSIKVLHKTLDSTKLNSEKGTSLSPPRSLLRVLLLGISIIDWLLHIVVELATLTREGEGDDAKTVIRIVPSEEIDALIAKYQEEVEAKKKQEKEKQKESFKMD